MVKFIKLKTGEEIIAKVDGAVGGVYLKTPVLVMLTNQGLAMMPWMHFIEGDIFIKEEDIMIKGEVKLDLANEYNSKFGSGVVTAPAGLADKFKV